MAGRYSDPPLELAALVREACTVLPEVVEEKAWAGWRWMVRRKTFAQVLDAERPFGTITVLTFRSAGEELDALRHAGPPFFMAGWGRDVVGLVLGDDTDWTEVAELVAESYCVMAPKKLAALVHGEG